MVSADAALIVEDGGQRFLPDELGRLSHLVSHDDGREPFTPLLVWRCTPEALVGRSRPDISPLVNVRHPDGARPTTACSPAPGEDVVVQRVGGALLPPRIRSDSIAVLPCQNGPSTMTVRLAPTYDELAI